MSKKSETTQSLAQSKSCPVTSVAKQAHLFFESVRQQIANNTVMPFTNSAVVEQIAFTALNGYKTFESATDVIMKNSKLAKTVRNLPKGFLSCIFIRTHEYPYRAVYHCDQFMTVALEPKSLNPTPQLMQRVAEHRRCFSLTHGEAFRLCSLMSDYEEIGLGEHGISNYTPSQTAELSLVDYFCGNYHELHPLSFMANFHSGTLKRCEKRNSRLAEWNTVAPIFGFMMEHDKVSILDVGGGDGQWAKVVTEWFPHAHVTVADTGLTGCPRYPNVDYLGVKPFLVLGERKFDLIVMNMSLHHMKIRPRILADTFSRLLDHSGLISIRDHEPTYLSEKWRIVAAHRVFEQIHEQAHECEFINFETWAELDSCLDIININPIQSADGFLPGAMPIGGFMCSAVKHYAHNSTNSMSGTLGWERLHLHNNLIASPAGILVSSLAHARAVTVSQMRSILDAPWIAISGDGDKALVHYRLVGAKLLPHAIMQLTEIQMPAWQFRPIAEQPGKHLKAICVRSRLPGLMRERSRFSEYEARHELEKTAPIGTARLAPSEITCALYSLMAEGYIQRYRETAQTGDAVWEWLPLASKLGVTAIAPRGPLLLGPKFAAGESDDMELLL